MSNSEKFLSMIFTCALGTVRHLSTVQPAGGTVHILSYMLLFAYTTSQMWGKKVKTIK